MATRERWSKESGGMGYAGMNVEVMNRNRPRSRLRKTSTSTSDVDVNEKSLSARTFFLAKILVSFLLICPWTAWSQTITVGVPKFEPEVNFLKSDHPVAEVVRSATIKGLIGPVPPGDSTGRLDLGLSDQYSTNPDFSVWSFHLRKGSSFTNGQEVRLGDLEFSLKRCRELGLFPHLESLVVEKRPGSLSTAWNSWVDIKVKAKPEVKDLPHSFPAALARCPILERRSSEAFGEQLGLGTNLVAAGDYEVTSFVAGRSFELKRATTGGRKTANGAQSIAIRAFKDGLTALSALRVGTADFVFNQEEAALQKTAKDNTLLVGECFAYKVIYRRILSFSCNAGLDWGEIRYPTG